MSAAESTHSSRGRSNRRRGAAAEVAVVNYLRNHPDTPYPDARRYLAGDGRQPGDLDWHPLVMVEVKDVASSAWPTWQRQALAECRAGLAAIVVRRTRGVPDVGQWVARVHARSWFDHVGQTITTTFEVHRTTEPGEWIEVTFADVVRAVAAADGRA